MRSLRSVYGSSVMTDKSWDSRCAPLISADNSGGLNTYPSFAAVFSPCGGRLPQPVRFVDRGGRARGAGKCDRKQCSEDPSLHGLSPQYA